MVHGEGLSTRAVAAGLGQFHLQPLMVGQRTQLQVATLQALIEATSNYKVTRLLSFGSGGYGRMGHR